MLLLLILVVRRFGDMYRKGGIYQPSYLLLFKMMSYAIIESYEKRIFYSMVSLIFAPVLIVLSL